MCTHVLLLLLLLYVVLTKNMFVDCVVDVDICITTDVQLSCYNQPTVLMCTHVLLLLLLLLLLHYYLCTTKMLLSTYNINVHTCIVVAAIIIIIIIVVIVIVLSKNVFVDCVVDIDVCITTDVQLSCFYQHTILMCTHVLLL